MGHPKLNYPLPSKVNFLAIQALSWSQQQESGNKLRFFPRFHSRDRRSVACMPRQAVTGSPSPFLRDTDTHIDKSERAFIFA